MGDWLWPHVLVTWFLTSAGLSLLSSLVRKGSAVAQW